jgi:hypothetical protein
MNTENMENSEIGAELTKADLARFWQVLHDGLSRPLAFGAAGGQERAQVRYLLQVCPKNQPKTAPLAAKKPQPAFRSAAWDSELWNCG